jgi:hypothetical protein
MPDTVNGSGFLGKSQVQDYKTTNVMQIYNLHFKWTISRGRDTDGYNICSLLVDGNKVASCMGGGYDMQGTALGNWLQDAFQLELLDKMERKAIIIGARHYDTKAGRVSYFAIEGFYGIWLKELQKANGITEKSMSLDGGCGFDSMRRIAEAIGIKLQWNKESDKYKNHSFYTAILD